jgi:hypothetical protein
MRISRQMNLEYRKELISKAYSLEKQFSCFRSGKTTDKKKLEHMRWAAGEILKSISALEADSFQYCDFIKIEPRLTFIQKLFSKYSKDSDFDYLQPINEEINRE